MEKEEYKRQQHAHPLAHCPPSACPVLRCTSVAPVLSRPVVSVVVQCYTWYITQKELIVEEEEEREEEEE